MDFLIATSVIVHTVGFRGLTRLTMLCYVMLCCCFGAVDVGRRRHCCVTMYYASLLEISLHSEDFGVLMPRIRRVRTRWFGKKEEGKGDAVISYYRPNWRGWFSDVIRFFR